MVAPTQAMISYMSDGATAQPSTIWLPAQKWSSTVVY